MDPDQTAPIGTYTQKKKFSQYLCFLIKSTILQISLSNFLLCFQRCIVIRLFYFSYKQVKHDFSLLRAYAIICGRVNITVN